MKLPELSTTKRRTAAVNHGEKMTLSRPNTRLTTAEAAALVAQYEAGGTVRGVAREFGIHHDTARRLLDDAGVARRKRVPLTKTDRAAAVELYESGATIQQVADQFSQKYQSMRQELLRAGVAMRPPVARSQD